MSVERTARIGFNPDFAPFTYEENEGAAGLIITKIKEICALAGINAEFVAAPLPELRTLLSNGDVDLLAVLADIPSRRSEYSFSKSLLISGAGWFVPIDLDYKNGDVPRNVVTPKQGPLVRQIENDFPTVKINTSSDYDGALQTVLYSNTGAEAAALNWHVGSMLIEDKYRGLFHMPEKPFNQMKLAMAGLPDDPKGLIEELNKYIPDAWGKL